VRFYKVDLSSPEAVRKAAEEVVKEVGHPYALSVLTRCAQLTFSVPSSVLINMAGVVRAKSILESPPQDVDLCIFFWFFRDW
jgi:NAD(P)-dependent dehydrogenase (short-subunit alcohol dehydrogenase family)